MITTRELPPSEWPRVTHIPPYNLGLPPDNGHWRIIVAEDAGEIVGCVALHSQVHFDPWWIARDRKTNPAIVTGLLATSVGILRELGVDHVFATIDETHLATQQVAEHLGFTAAPGRLWLVDVDRLEV
jgi:hypothetical protein